MFFSKGDGSVKAILTVKQSSGVIKPVFKFRLLRSTHQRKKEKISISVLLSRTEADVFEMDTNNTGSVLGVARLLDDGEWGYDGINTSSLTLNSFSKVF